MDDTQLDNILPPEGDEPATQPTPSSSPIPTGEASPTFDETIPPASPAGGSVLAASREHMKGQTGKKKRGLGLIVAIVAVLLLVIVGGMIIAAYRGYINLPLLFPRPTLNDAFNNLNQIETARIGSRFSLKTTERQPDTKILSFVSDDAENQMEKIESLNPLGAVPSDLYADFSLSMDVTRNMDSPQGEITLSGSFETEGLSAEIAGRALLVDEDVYLRADTIPPIISTFLGPLKNNWIKASSADEESDQPDIEVFKYKNELNGNGEADEFLSGRMDPLAEIELLLKRAVARGVMTSGKPERTSDPLGREAWLFRLAVDPDGLTLIQNDMYDQREQLFPKVERFYILKDRWTTLVDNLSVDAEQIGEILDAVRSDLYVDRESYLPIAYVMSMSVATEPGELPPLDEKQIDVMSELTFQDINQPVKVEAPEEYLLWGQAIQAASGRTEEDQMMRDQAGIIGDLRYALDYYHEINGRHPSSLNALLGLEIMSPFAFENPDEFTRVVVNIPNDLYTGKSFGYSLDEELGEYRLEYQMRVPQVSSFIDRYDFAQGTNTATSQEVSLEGIDNPAVDPGAKRPADAVPADKLDTDEDGLSDLREVELGTDPNNPDSDGDGYLDGEEVSGGYNPLGE